MEKKKMKRVKGKKNETLTHGSSLKETDGRSLEKNGKGGTNGVEVGRFKA